jgi:hypothetical protein
MNVISIKSNLTRKLIHIIEYPSYCFIVDGNSPHLLAKKMNEIATGKATINYL